MEEVSREEVLKRRGISFCLNLDKGLEFRFKNISAEYLTRVLPNIIQWIQFHHEFDSLYAGGQLQGGLPTDKSSEQKEGGVQGDVVEGWIENPVSDPVDRGSPENKETS